VALLPSLDRRAFLSHLTVPMAAVTHLTAAAGPWSEELELSDVLPDSEGTGVECGSEERPNLMRQSDDFALEEHCPKKAGAI